MAIVKSNKYGANRFFLRRRSPGQGLCFCIGLQIGRYGDFQSAIHRSLAATYLLFLHTHSVPFLYLSQQRKNDLITWLGRYPVQKERRTNHRD